MIDEMDFVLRKKLVRETLDKAGEELAEDIRDGTIPADRVDDSIRQKAEQVYQRIIGIKSADNLWNFVVTAIDVAAVLGVVEDEGWMPDEECLWEDRVPYAHPAVAAYDGLVGCLTGRLREKGVDA